MQKISTSHLVYFFIILFPLSNYLFPFFFFGDEINIRIYLDGTFGVIEPTTDTDVKFQDDGTYSISKHQGYVYNIKSKNIYISLLYVLIFFLTAFFTFTFKNKHLHYDVRFLIARKKKYFQSIFLLLIFIMAIKYFELSKISNIFTNLLLISKILILFFSCSLLFSSKNKKEVIFFIATIILLFVFIIELRSKNNLPITYNLIFYSYFLSVIFCIFLNQKKKLTLINFMILGIAGVLLISISFLWKENLRSHSNYNWYKLSKKIENNIINKPFRSNNLIYSVLSAPLNRINKLDQLSYIVETKENHKLLYGKSYIPLLSKFIPRQIWKNKPTETFGNSYGRDYKLIPFYDNTTSVGASTIVEAYINFRFLGIVILAIFYGLIYRSLNYYIHRYKDQNTNLSFLIISIGIFISITFESNLSSGMGGALQWLFVAVIYNIFSKMQKGKLKKDEI